MAQVEGFPDVAVADLAGTDYLYVRRSVQAPGSRDARFGFTALLRSFLGLTVAADTLPYGNATNGLAVTTFTSLARSLLGRSTAPLMRGDLGFLTATAVLDFSSIAANAKADLTITVTGAKLGDAVFLGLPATPAAGLVFNGFVSAADTVTVRASNTSSGSVDAASATYMVTVINSV